MKRLIISNLLLACLTTIYAADAPDYVPPQPTVHKICRTELRLDHEHGVAFDYVWERQTFTTPELMAAARRSEGDLRRNLSQLRLEKFYREHEPFGFEIRLDDLQIRDLALSFVADYNAANHQQLKLDLDKLMKPIDSTITVNDFLVPEAVEEAHE